MSYREIDRTGSTLESELAVLEMSNEQRFKLIDALADYIDARIDDQIDRLFNRGDYR